ncbi:MAG: radical SAM protein [Acidobacteria bacterium]|nr:radical SAM protein [Acidobacteriota bacterium]
MKIEPILKRIHPLPWPPKETLVSGAYKATKRPSRGVITWNINTTCNYRCSYCTQKFLDNRARWSQDTTLFLEGFRKLPGEWEVKLSGGEPFQHPTLLEIVAGLKNLGHFVSIVTNFSASEKKLLAFLSALEDKLLVFSASLHLEYINNETTLAEFIKKSLLVQNNLPKEASFNATCVATQNNLSKLKELVDRFSSQGLRLKIQPEKQFGDVINYSQAEETELIQLGGHNGLGKVAWSFLGRPCWAGAFSFTLDDLGNAWRCYPARRFRAQYLGNFLSPDFHLATGPSPCLYSYCNCTVPIERGMMPKDKNLEVENET